VDAFYPLPTDDDARRILPKPLHVNSFHLSYTCCIQLVCDVGDNSLFLVTIVAIRQAYIIQTLRLPDLVVYSKPLLH